MISRRSLASLITAVVGGGLVAIKKLSTRYNPHASTLPAPRRMVGINVLNAGFNAATIPLLRQLGVTRVRVTLYWSLWDGSAGTTGAAWLAMIDAFRAANIDVLVVCHAEGWDTLLPTYTITTVTTAFAAFMAARAAERPGLTWQIMNEMDGAENYGPWFGAGDGALTQNQRGDLYGQLLGPVYDAIKAADSTAKVISGGIALEPTAFFAGLAGRAPGKYDAIAVHCYASPTKAVFHDKSVAMRAVLGSTPLWCTETGNNQSDETVQAADVGAMLDDNDKSLRYERLYLYTLVGDGNYGITRSDGSRRQVALLLPDRAAP